MGAGGSIRKLRGAKVQISEITRRVQVAMPQAFLRSRWRVSAGRAIRTGWVTFETAPKIAEFEPETETRSQVFTITSPRREGKPSGASIHVPEGDWSALEQLREERDRTL